MLDPAGGLPLVDEPADQLANVGGKPPAVLRNGLGVAVSVVDLSARLLDRAERILRAQHLGVAVNSRRLPRHRLKLWMVAVQQRSRLLIVVKRPGDLGGELPGSG